MRAFTWHRRGYGVGLAYRPADRVGRTAAQDERHAVSDRPERLLIALGVVFAGPLETLSATG
jgi:hypothetical protein